MTLKGHEDSVNSVAYSADGLFIASGSKDGTLRIWDIRSGEEKMAPLRSGGVTSVAFVPDGTSVVSGTETGIVYIWNLFSGRKPMRQLIGHTAAVVSVALSSDSQFLASASQDRTVRVWTLATGRPFSVLEKYAGQTKEIAVSSDGEVMTFGSYHFRGIALPNYRFDEKRHFRVSKTGQSMISVQGQSICLWTQQDQNEPSLIRLEGHTAKVRSAVISPNSSYVASASDDGTIRIWEICSGNEPSQTLSDNSQLKSMPRMQAISLKGANIVSVFDDSSVHIWNAQTGETRLQNLEENAQKIKFMDISSDGRLIVTESEHGPQVRMWNARTGEAIGEPLPGVTGPKLSPDARWLASVSPTQFHEDEDSSIAEYEMRIWDIERGQEAHRFPLPSKFVETFENEFDLFLDMERSPKRDIWTISPDSRLIAVRTEIDRVHLWRIESNLEALQPLQTAQSTCAIIFSPDSTHIASGGRDNTGHIWSVTTRKLVLELAGHNGPVTRIVFSPDGQLVATASEDENVRLWDAKTGLSIATLYGHRNLVELLGFANDEYLVSGHYDGTISVWDVNAARLMFQYGVKDAIKTLTTATLKDGWLTGPSGELLTWVPAEYRPYLHIAPCTQRIGNRSVFIKEGVDGWHRGQTWTSCWCGSVLSSLSHTV